MAQGFLSGLTQPGGVLSGEGNLMTNPMFNFGIGLLQGSRPGGTFAGGMQRGLLMAQRGSQLDQQNQFRQMQMEEMQAAQAQRNRQQQLAEQMASAYEQPTPYQLPPEQQFTPGEQISGLMNAPSEQDQLTANMIRANPQEFTNRAFESMFPKPTAPASNIQEYQFLKGLGLSDKEAMDRAFAAPTGATINISDKLRAVPEQFKLDYAKSLGERISANAVSAPAQRQRMAQGKEYLRALVQGGDPTGVWLPMKAEASRWLGVNPEMVQNSQMFMNLAGQQVMNTIQQTKGAVSEKEMAYFEKINIGADKDPFTNFVLMEIADRASAREQDKARYFSQYVAQHGDAMGFEDWYLKNKDPVPEFSLEQLRKQYAVEMKGQAPNAADDEAWARKNGYVD